MPPRTREPRPLDAPLSEWERSLFERLSWADLSPALKAALTDYVSVNGSLHVSSMPTLKGEEWREVGETGQPAFGTNYSNLGGADQTTGFYRDALGIVRLKGALTKNGTPAAGDVLFTLPEGYRPSKNEYFPIATGSSIANSAGTIRIETDGEIIWLTGTTGETDFTSLAGISFRAA